MSSGRIGIEWVQQYHGRGTDLTSTKDNAEGFYNKLDGTRAFSWGDDLAWDIDFEEEGAGKPDRGTDASWVDNVDIAYFAGHGSHRGPSFGVDDHDDGLAAEDEVRLGNGLLEWIVYDACHVMKKDGDYYNNSFNMFRGLHFMLGFHTQAHGATIRGRIFAEYLNAGYTVRSAWINACKETEGATAKWGYLRAKDDDNNTYLDHWIGKGSQCGDPDPDDQTIIYSNGSC